MAWLIIIENLGSEATEATVRELLTPHGEVEAVHLRRDDAGPVPMTVASVQVQSGKQGRDAIAALDGSEHAGRSLKVRVLKGDGGSRPQSGLRGTPGAAGRGGRASVFGEKGALVGHKGIGKGGGRGR